MIFWIIGFSWFLIGCVVLATIDGEDQTLFKWASSSPIPLGYELVILAWPVVVWFWYKDRA